MTSHEPCLHVLTWRWLPAHHRVVHLVWITLWRAHLSTGVWSIPRCPQNAVSPRVDSATTMGMDHVPLCGSGARARSVPRGRSPSTGPSTGCAHPAYRRRPARTPFHPHRQQRRRRWLNFSENQSTPSMRLGIPGPRASLRSSTSSCGFRPLPSGCPRRALGSEPHCAGALCPTLRTAAKAGMP